MLALSVAGLRERWPLFAGAFLSVAVGVALVASALTVAGSASSPDTVGLSAWDAAEVREAFDGVATVMIISAMLAGLLAVFIVATTFAFTVSERRRELALLRLLGGARHQVRLVLLGESLALGGLGAAAGIALVRPAVSAQLWLLHRADFVPEGFVVAYRSWPLWAAAGIGVSVAVLGVLAASRRASAVPPLEAVRGAADRTRVMGAGRWIVGIAALLLAAVQVAAGAFVGLVIALALGMGIALAGAVALSRLAPLLVPVAGRVLGLPFRTTTLGGLAEANGRQGVQRSASTAAPVIVLVALVISLTSALAATTTAVTIEGRAGIQADLVVSATGADAAAVAGVPGVRVISPEGTPDIAVDLPMRDNGERTTERFLDGYVVVDPGGYAAVHAIRPVAGSLGDLVGNTIAVTERPTDGVRFSVGDRASVTIGTVRTDVRVAAVLPERLDTDQEVLIPRDLVPPGVLAAAPADVFVQLEDRSDAQQVAAAASSYGEVATVDQFVAADAEDLQRTNDATLVVLLALAGLYTFMAVVNAIVIAGTGRRREHAVARLSGLTRAQVVATTALEAAIVTITGLLLGLAVVAAAVLAIALAARRSVGQAVIEVPWAVLAATTLGTLAASVAVAAVVSWQVTRTLPVALTTARE